MSVFSYITFITDTHAIWHKRNERENTKSLFSLFFLRDGSFSVRFLMPYKWIRGNRYVCIHAPFRLILLTYFIIYSPWFFSISLSVGKVWLDCETTKVKPLLLPVSPNEEIQQVITLSLFLIPPSEPTKRNGNEFIVRVWKLFAEDGMNPNF